MSYKLMAVMQSVATPSCLKISNIFVDTLPADTILDVYPRQVLAACYSFVEPKKTQQPKLVAVSHDAATSLGFSQDDIRRKGFLDVVSGNAIYEGMKPYACCYGGHQFGNWAGQLGDGRAINLGEQNVESNTHWALQLKGAGPTPYSRHADGLAVLRSSVREFLCSEAMFYLGVPTTRALSLALTGDLVERDMFYDGNRKMEPGAVVCRVAPSFLRFGNFEIFSARSDTDTLRQLMDFTITHEFPHLKNVWDKNPIDAYLSMFKEVVDSTCEMIVHWMRVGFVHGVMNTDNMSILGLTIDYGPYGWLDNFDPNWTPNTTDAQQQRYRYANQPAIAQWNLLQLANALYPLIKDAKALESIIRDFSNQYDRRWQAMMASKLGLSDVQKGDNELFLSLEKLLTLCDMDMTLFYRLIADIKSTYCNKTNSLDDTAEQKILITQLMEVSYLNQFSKQQEEHIFAWFTLYNKRSLTDKLDIPSQVVLMNSVNPVIILRNYLVQEAIDLASEGEFSRINELLESIKHPYSSENIPESFIKKRPEWAMKKAGCSALSCSS